ncbi:hypothetical protein ACK3SF_03040 [Candidatus Nanosalina sp. VS9-1]|uniref:hypothetical protein n=1 Tax=Candidatus Nanosalina sp. VS9-1 TaxID=3388566 RepID=UPI0039E1405A
MPAWETILHDESIDINHELEREGFAPGVTVEAPPGFGRSEYEEMVEQLWSDGDIEAMTVLDRSLDFMDEASAATKESLQAIYDTTASGDFDGEEYALGVFGTGLGLAGIGMSVAALPVIKAGKAASKNIQNPLYTSSDVLYDEERDIGEQEVARVFYTEDSDGRYLKFTGPLERGPDSDVVQEGIEYLEDFSV